MTTLCLTFWLLTSCVVSVSPRRAAILVAHVIAEYHTP